MLKLTTTAALAAGLILLAGIVGTTYAACRDSVQEAQATYVDVSQKVKKMKRLHQARRMMSMNEMGGLDQDLQTLKAMIGDARSLCDREQDGASTAKAHEAIELAKAVDERHVALMTDGKAMPAGHSDKSDMKGGSHGKTMKH